MEYNYKSSVLIPYLQGSLFRLRVNDGSARHYRVLIPYLQGSLFRLKYMEVIAETKSLNPLSTGKSVQTLPAFFPFVKQRFTEAKYFKLCISKVAV